MRGTYIGNERMLVSTAWNGRLIIPSNDLGIGPELIINGYYDIGLTKFLLNNIKKGDTVVDIGANIGLFSILSGFLVGDEGKVYSFEPNAEIFKYLQDNISMNWLRRVVFPIQKGIYNTEKKLRFNINKNAHFLSSIKQNELWNSNGFVDDITEVEIEVHPLDKYYNEFGYVKLVKLDVEGVEYESLLGMEKMISEQKVELITFEWNIPMLQNNTRKMIGLLESYESKGYNLFKINESGMLDSINASNLIEVEQIPNVLMKI
jgi:FkbM family methyltransferase